MAKQIDSTSGYSPEVEARRADYEALARCLLTLIELDMCRQPQLLDIESERSREEDHTLMNALDKHIYLAYEAVDWYSEEGMKLYVELRLLTDEQRTRRGREEIEAMAEIHEAVE